MNKEILKAGYHVKVTSWENDADNYWDKTVHCETLDEALAIFDFAQMFRSKNDRNNPGIGNIYDAYSLNQESFVDQAFVDFHNQYPGFFDPEHTEQIEDWEDSDTAWLFDAASDWKYELGLSSEDFYTRVADRITLTHVAETVYGDELKVWTR